MLSCDGYIQQNNWPCDQAQITPKLFLWTTEFVLLMLCNRVTFKVIRPQSNRTVLGYGMLIDSIWIMINFCQGVPNQVINDCKSAVIAMGACGVIQTDVWVMDTTFVKNVCKSYSTGCYLLYALYECLDIVQNICDSLGFLKHKSCMLQY